MLPSTRPRTEAAPEATLPLALLLAAAAQAGCDQLLELALRGAEKKIASGNTGIAEDARSAREAVPCLESALTAEQAARFHRLQAVDAWASGNTARAEAHLSGMVAAAPLLRLDDVVTTEHPLAQALIAVEEARSAPIRALPWPDQGTLVVNGTEGAAYPTDRPWLFQRVADGHAEQSAWVDAGAVPPAYPHGGAPIARTRDRKGAGWKLAGVGTGLVAGGLYGAAWAQNARYHDAVAQGDNDAIGNAYTLTNGLAIGSTAAAGAAATLLVVGFTR